METFTVSTLLLKNEWACTCKNCGCDSHCDTTCTRTERHYPIDGYMEYPIEVCRQCRCEACEA